MGRKRYSAELKATVALEAIKGERTANELAQEFGINL
jgi:transposase-like protein